MKQWTVLAGLVCLGIGASQVAQGAEGLSWDLAGQTVRYRIQTDIASPQAIPIAAKKNDAFRSNHVQATVDTWASETRERNRESDIAGLFRLPLLAAANASLCPSRQPQPTA